MIFVVQPREDKQRLDHVLSNRFPEVSRSFLQGLCKRNQVLINKKTEKSGYKLSRGDTVELLFDMSSIGTIPEITIPIIYEDEHMLVVNKPAGVLSHALSKFKQEPSVASFLRQHATASTKQPDMRYGIIHRLDRVTSGVMICAKTDEAMKHFQAQFAERSVKKTYVAVVTGSMKHERATIDVPIERNPKKPATFRPGPNGKSAQTDYEVELASNRYSLIRLHPRTGRTHQLRVHLQYVGCPIVGDFLYGGEKADRLFLHAQSITVQLLTDKFKTFTAPLPTSFAAKMTESEGENK